MTRPEADRLAVIARAQLRREHNGCLVIADDGTVPKGDVGHTDWRRWETYKAEIARKFAPIVEAPYDWRAWWNAGNTTLAKEATRLKKHPKYTKAEW